MTRRLIWWRPAAAIGLLGVVLSASGCSSSGQLTVDDAAFQGLDSAVVREVLRSPSIVAKIAEEPAETQVSLAQGMVRNVTLCRSYAEALTEWERTGVAPDAPQLPVPTHPVNPSAEDWADYQAFYADALASGDADNLRAALTTRSGCGAWVTTQAGGSTTIAAAVQGG